MRGFIGAALICLFMVTYIPWLALVVPRLLGLLT
jgi:hypothetical protein